MTVAAQAISTGSATALALRRARKDLQNAVLMGLDTHRRRQYALSAQDEAATVLLAGDANAGQLRYARLYFTAASTSRPPRHRLWRAHA